MDNRTMDEIRNNETKLIKEIEELKDKFKKAMNLINYLDSVGLIQDEESFTTLCELREERLDE